MNRWTTLALLAAMIVAQLGHACGSRFTQDPKALTSNLLPIGYYAYQGYKSQGVSGAIFEGSKEAYIQFTAKLVDHFVRPMCSAIPFGFGKTACDVMASENGMYALLRVADWMFPAKQPAPSGEEMQRLAQKLNLDQNITSVPVFANVGTSTVRTKCIIIDEELWCREG